MKNLENLLIIFFLLIVCPISAQTIITGTITDIYNNPIPFANVYLLKTTVETTTDKDGNYLLEIPQNGKYQLFASGVGFETSGINVEAKGGTLVANLQLASGFIKISQTEIEASEQCKKKYYGFFIKLFLGETLNATSCKILNPNELFLVEKKETHILKGFSSRPLRIENKALGYTIFYDLKSFTFNPHTRDFKFSGNFHFMAYKSKSQKQKYWNRNRHAAYIGSRMQFIRSLYTNSLEKDNFEIYESDSLDINAKVKNLKPLKYCDLISSNDQISKTFYYKKPVTIVYNDSYQKLVNIPSEYETNYYKSYLVFNDSVQIFQNGTYTPPSALIWKGEMINARVADLLPFDYQPIEMKKTRQITNSELK